MNPELNTPVIVSFLIYFIALMVIGYYFYKRTANLTDYLLGGRKLGSAVTALSAGASDMSGWLLLGLPGAFFATGLHNLWMVLGLIIGAYLNWQLIARRLRLYTEIADDSITISDYFANRFEDESHLLRITSALIIIFFFTLYTSSGLVSGAKLFEASFNVSYEAALYIGGIIIIAYTFLGGYQAVSWTDFIQALLMMLALIVVPVAMLSDVNTLEKLEKTINASNSNLVKLIPEAGIIGIISLMAWGLGYFGQPHILVRFMSAKTVNHLPQAKRIAMTWMLISMIGAVLTGFVGLAYFSGNGMTLADSEKIFISLVNIIFNPWVAGILLAAILAAIMSTVDSQLLVASSALTADFYQQYMRKHATEKELVWISRVAVLFISLLALFISSDKETKVIDLVAYAWAGFGASFGPIIIISLFWKRMTRNSAIVGIVTGALTVIVWKNLDGGIFGLYELFPGFLFSCFSIIVTSLMDKEPSDIIKAKFIQATEKLN